MSFAVQAYFHVNGADYNIIVHALDQWTRDCIEHGYRQSAYKWQNPLMNFALYIISAAISILRMRYIVSKYFISSDFVVDTVVPGPSRW